jgi:hypothetical protein
MSVQEQFETIESTVEATIIERDELRAVEVAESTRR